MHRKEGDETFISHTFLVEGVEIIRVDIILVCNQSNKQRKSSVICSGCQISFCKEHHEEHRKSINKDFEDLIQQHNIIRQELFNGNNDESTSMPNLLKKIDDWEKQMITNIKATAASNKRRITQMMNEEKDELKDKFKLIATELKTNQSDNDYVEPDIQNWQKQINECKQKLEQLQKGNNNFIEVDIKPLDWKNIFTICKRREVKVMTRVREEKSTVPLTNQRRGAMRNYEIPIVVGSRSNLNETENSDYDANVCFHGDCDVLLASGMTKLVKDIRKGDLLATPTGLKASVNYVVKSLSTNTNALMVRFDNGLVITPWHPIRINSIWKFPNDIEKLSIVECKEVYNFVLDSGHIVFINGIQCVTLAHGFKGDVIEHPYYGTEKVLKDLLALPIAKDGLIEILPNSTVRDSETGLVMGISQSIKRPSWKQHSHLDIFVQ
ncbi:hypothetical protein I4U23_027396 [Adineta vaga]|nr:hypothetical protein I4U23_027396 [Adineta vaga]